MNNSNHTIVALATAPLNCAIHIIRISGEDAYKITNNILNMSLKKNGYRIQRRRIIDNKKVIDDVLCMTFIKPKSYTGEDLIEINCHGSYFLATKIIGLLIKNGAKNAQNGEFSFRSFINKKINIVQAESINSLCCAKNDLAINTAAEILTINNKNANFLQNISQTLFKIIGQLEVNIDYPEYDDVPQLNNKTIIKKLNMIINQINLIVKNSQNFLRLTNGINVLILGKPNSGKSTLFNCLINEKRAIVTNTPGTTRDLINYTLTIDQMTLNFIDSAGIRKNTSDQIEKIGIQNAIGAIKNVDLILVVIDASTKNIQNTYKYFSKIIYDNEFNKKDIIYVLNKIDRCKTKLISIATNIDVASISAKNQEINSL
jgi:tRNA modification GTPase